MKVSPGAVGELWGSWGLWGCVQGCCVWCALCGVLDCFVRCDGLQGLSIWGLGSVLSFAGVAGGC